MAELTTLARPYAKAAFEHARQNDELAGWGEMLALAAAIARDEQVRSRILGNPLLARADAAGFFIEVGGDRFDEDFANFIRLLADNRRLQLLPQVHELFGRYRAEAERTLDVEVTTAVDLPDDYRERLEKALAKRFDRKVSVSLKKDESIIGGAVIRAGDTVLDGSVKGRLALLAQAISR